MAVGEHLTSSGGEDSLPQESINVSAKWEVLMKNALRRGTVLLIAVVSLATCSAPGGGAAVVSS